MAILTITSMNAALRDRYPAPGERIKQYVLDERARDAWERETCPRLEVPYHHEDQDDIEAAAGSVIACPSVGSTMWIDLHGGTCRFCDGFLQAAQRLPEMVAWFAARERYHAEHPICEDRAKLSDEIAPPLGDLRDNPILAFIRKRTR